MNRVRVWLILICLLFLITRLFQIDKNPPSLYWDEASIGYNAYSILTTGKDEWGKAFPLHFRAFGEFKLPVYIYTVSFFEAVLGLNELAVRLPAVIYSLGSLLLVYFLTKKLFKLENIALWASLFFATCPYFFIFSRTGYEATAGLFFYLLGIYLLTFKKLRYFITSAISFVLSMYSYNSFRIIVPLGLIILLWYLFSEKFFFEKQFYKSLVIFLLIIVIGLIPIIRFLSTGGNIRFEQISVLKTNQPFTNFISNYLSHFSLQFLLISGDKNERSQITGFGQLSIIQFLFILMGGYWVVTKQSREGIFIISLLLASPIAASLTTESPHALRSLTIAPFLAIVASLGCKNFESKLKLNNYYSLTIVGIILVFFGYYFYQFLTIYPFKSAKNWQYPYKRINTEYLSLIKTNQSVYISPTLGQPYIFSLFYLHYDPNKFRSEVLYNPASQWGVSTVGQFGKFHFVDALSPVSNSLIFRLTDDTIKLEHN